MTILKDELIEKLGMIESLREFVERRATSLKELIEQRENIEELEESIVKGYEGYLYIFTNEEDFLEFLNKEFEIKNINTESYFHFGYYLFDDDDYEYFKQKEVRQ